MSDTFAARNALIPGIVLGLLVWIMTTGSVGWFAGLVLGIIAAVLLTGLIGWMSQGSPAEDGSAWEPQPVAAPVEPVVEPVETVAQPQVQPKAVKEVAETPVAEAPKPKSEAAKPVAAPKPAAAARPAAKPKSEAKKPVAARADDLKEIKGVGPKLEEVLHENGVTTFAQIAAWDDAEVDHFAELLGRLGGRIRSEEWVEQARVLAGNDGAA
ncbi:hypothetical protein JJJ17_05595 [Paracoccus caeni]|uniref:Uncharacterized protein n=1 Tax=Paracoccus caeni TaxID=657651 RepID=A0A934SEB5_9RHOB|nr:hypothetical protein [Paracoccus caeni]MBK4215396.1 hypothetical protein [Paracoccus caeni]